MSDFVKWALGFELLQSIYNFITVFLQIILVCVCVYFVRSLAVFIVYYNTTMVTVLI